MTRATSTTWALWSASVLGVIVYGAFVFVDRDVALAPRYGFHASRLTDMLVTVGVASLGLLVAQRQRSNPIGWLWLTGGLASALSLAARGYAVHGLLVDPGSLPAARWGAWAVNWLWVPGFALPVVFVLLVFPDGHLPRRRGRPVLWLAVTASAGAWIGAALVAGKLEDFPTVTNPVGIQAAAPLAALTLLLPVVVVLAVAGLVSRFRTSDYVVRQQIKWVAYAGVGFAITFLVAMVVQPWNSPGTEVWLVGVPGLGLCAATVVAVLRYRLFDIDVLINRTLVYAALTMVVLAVSVGVVGLLTAVVGSITRLPVSLAAATVAALVGLPARQRVQARVNRLMYGDRDEPYAVVARLGRRVADALSTDTLLAGVAETLAVSLRFPYVAVEVYQEGELEPAASYGIPRGHPETFPLQHHGLEVGRLVVARRDGREPLTPADLTLLRDLAQQVAAAVHAVGLARELQHSREHLVIAREEERLRIRRDLHDGLGPTLAALALSAQAARQLVGSDPDEARTMLDQLQRDAQEAVNDIRRLVYGLRPPALDELGLIGAIREHATRLGIDVDAPEEIGPLAAAVEVAALRIATEAMTNVARHAAARHASIRVALNGNLELDIADDGLGLSDDVHAGVGLRSMRERVSELGGSCVVDSVPGVGTAVHVRLPVSRK